VRDGIKRAMDKFNGCTTTVASPARLRRILALADRSERFRDLAERLEDRRSTKIADASAGARAFAWARSSRSRARAWS
jgi:hypothetical protein